MLRRPITEGQEVAQRPRDLKPVLFLKFDKPVKTGSAEDAGMRVFRDPATGAFTAPPTTTGTADALSAVDATRARALETAPSELVEEPGTSPAGGVTLDLRGRFQSDQSATVDANGALHTRCHPGEAR